MEVKKIFPFIELKLSSVTSVLLTTYRRLIADGNPLNVCNRSK